MKTRHAECETAHLEGGGCAAPRVGGCCPEAIEVAPCDSGEICESTDRPNPGIEAHYHGSGACEHVSVGTPMLLGTLLLILLRRVAPVVLVCVIAAPAMAIDVESFQLLDGGPVPGLQDPSLGEDWTTRLSTGATGAAAPVRISSPGEAAAPVVGSLWTSETALSLQVRDWFVVGFALPLHYVHLTEGDSAYGTGDRVYFFRLPLQSGSRGASAVDIRFQAPFPAIRESTDPVFGGPANAWAKGTSASVGWAASRSGRRTWVGGRVSARFQQRMELIGLFWTSRWEAVLGARREFGPLGVGGTLTGSAPLAIFTSPRGSWPLEGNGFVAIPFSDRTELQLGGGGGLTRGLGAPSIRGFAAIQSRWDDRDEDGIADLRDLCPARPEDRDGFRDIDGCPDPDNDKDGFADLDDACPNEPEVVNDWEDGDGCPDLLVDWRIAVRSSRDLETFHIAVDDRAWDRVDPELALRAVPGTHTLEVSAPGHDPVAWIVELSDPEHLTEVELVPFDHADAWVQLVSVVDETPLAGTVSVAGQTFEVPTEGGMVRMRVGARTVEARSDGFEPDAARILVSPKRVTRTVIELQPKAEQAVPPDVVFDLDSADLGDGGVDLVDRLAAWLLERRDIALLRVEGHADEVGGSAYNLDLSQRRADAVVDALVDRGVGRDRLQPIGSGEGQSWLSLGAAEPDTLVAGQALREVSFRVLVWSD